jgi:hypothetical protein
MHDQKGNSRTSIFYVMEKMHDGTSKYTVKSLGSFRLIANKKQTVRDNNDQNYVHKSKT